METFCVSVPLPILMDLAALTPYGLLTIKEIINFLSELVNFCPSSALMVIHSKGVESSSFLLNLLWNIAHHILIPVGKGNCASFKIGCYPFRRGRKGTWVPSSFNDFTRIFPFDPHDFKMETMFAFMGWRRGGGGSVVVRMQWSDVDFTSWCTLGFLKCSNHSEVAKTLSKQSDILSIPSF